MSEPTNTKPNDAPVTHGELDALLALFKGKNDTLAAENTELKRQLEWFKRQMFGPKSEKLIDPNPYQLSLGEAFAPPESAVDTRPKEKITYERGKGPKVRPEDCVTEAGLRIPAQSGQPFWN